MWSRIKFRLMWYNIGLLTGAFFCVLISVYHSREIERIEEQNKKFETLYLEDNLKLTEQVNQLTEENKSLKSSTKIVEKKNADGSSEKIYENDTEAQSSKSIAEYRVKAAELTARLSKQEVEYTRKLSEIERHRASYGIHLGMDRGMVPYLDTSYTMFGGVSLQLRVNKYGETALGIGVIQ